MSIPTIFRDSLEKKWYTQGVNAHPIYIQGAAGLVDEWTMKEHLGYGYDYYIFTHENGYCEGSYQLEDLERLWEEIRKRLDVDPNYLKTVRAMYDKEVADTNADFDTFVASNGGIEKLSTTQLAVALKKGIRAMAASIGLAHIIEPIGLGVDPIFRKALREEVKTEQEFAQMFNLLTTPTQQSFIAREEKALLAIQQLPETERTAAMREHLQEWEWVFYTYQGPRTITETELQKRAKNIEKQELTEYMREERTRVENENRFSPELMQLADIIDYTTIWQDDRKAIILQSVGKLGAVVEAVSRTIGMPQLLLCQLSVSDIAALEDTQQLQEMGQELQERVRGAAYVVDPSGSTVVFGEQYKEFIPQWKKVIMGTDGAVYGQLQLRGLTANTGTVIGPVKLCMSIDQIPEVQEGDILVTSMTRPEFMPALKKAAAIVTDEGGITSHASIVSRELGIPAIIGTKMATKVLRDGMQVEVRANHGFVRIVK